MSENGRLDVHSPLGIDSSDLWALRPFTTHTPAPGLHPSPDYLCPTLTDTAGVRRGVDGGLRRLGSGATWAGRESKGTGVLHPTRRSEWAAGQAKTRAEGGPRRGATVDTPPLPSPDPLSGLGPPR